MPTHKFLVKILSFACLGAQFAGCQQPVTPEVSTTPQNPPTLVANSHSGAEAPIPKPPSFRELLVKDFAAAKPSERVTQHKDWVSKQYDPKVIQKMAKITGPQTNQ